MNIVSFGIHRCALERTYMLMCFLLGWFVMAEYALVPTHSPFEIVMGDHRGQWGQDWIEDAVEDIIQAERRER